MSARLKRLPSWTRNWMSDCFSKANGRSNLHSKVVFNDNMGPKLHPSLQIESVCISSDTGDILPPKDAANQIKSLLPPHPFFLSWASES